MQFIVFTKMFKEADLDKLIERVSRLEKDSK